MKQRNWVGNRRTKNLKTDVVEMSLYYIGIDGGGTKTEFILTDSNGIVCKRIVAKGCNPNDIGIDKSCAIISDGIELIMKECFISASDLYIYAGVSGEGFGENAKMMTEKLLCKFPHITVKSDLTNALESSLKGDSGIVVICGTGISCLIYDGFKYKTIAGYGYLFEEGGSGYSFGRDAIIAALKAEDGCGAETVLNEYIRQQYSFPLRSNLPKLLSSKKSEIAAFCPLVFKGYEQGDKVCKDIVERNFDCIIQLINSAKKIYGDKPCKIGFIGGLTENSDFQKIIKEAFVKDLLFFESFKPVYGAVRLAALMAGIVCNDEFERNYQKSLGELIC